MAMGRPRIHNKHLPRRLILRSGAHYFIHKNGRQERLLNEDGTRADYGQSLKMWAERMGEKPEGPIRTLGDAFDVYEHAMLNGLLPKKKSARSIKNNLQQFKALRKAFSRQPPEDTVPSDIYAFMDNRVDKNGRPVRFQANREVELLSSVFNFLIRKGRVQSNPCKEVQRFEEKPRDRDVEVWEYNAVYGLAGDRMQVAMDIARLTSMREGDIIRLSPANGQERGITVTTGKTKRKMRYLWTLALKKPWDRLVDLAASAKVKGRVISIKEADPTVPLFRGRRGRPLSESGFQSEWQRLMRQAMVTGVIQERFTFHDIRAMAAGEYGEDSHELLGNSPEVAERVYNRKVREVTPIR
jgi:integrase